MVRIHAGQPHFPNENADFENGCKQTAQKTDGFTHRGVTFPVTITNRAAKVKIFGPKPDFPYYRMYYRVGGKSCFKAFDTYGAAKKWFAVRPPNPAENIVPIVTPRTA